MKRGECSFQVLQLIVMDSLRLSKENGFTEETSNSVCTQYESRDCSRF